MRQIFLCLLFFCCAIQANERWFKAAEQGDTEALKAMLASKAVDIDAQDGAQDTALIITLKSLSLHKNQSAALELINQGANIRLFDKHGIQPIHLAVAQGADEIIDQLIENGADLLAVTGPSFEQNGDPTIGHSSVLHFASRLPGAKWVNILVKNYPELLDIRDNLGRTPLHIAARLGNHKPLEALCDAAGMRNTPKLATVINDIDTQGFTALGKAVQGNHVACAKVLLNAKASHNMPMGDVKLDLVKRNIWLDDAGIRIELRLQNIAGETPMTIKQFADLRVQLGDNFKTLMPMSLHRSREISARINQGRQLSALFGFQTRKRKSVAQAMAVSN